MALAKTTQDHAEIQKWAEARGGKPAAVAATEKEGSTGILRLMFPDAPQSNDGALEEISWDEFFEKFDASGLEFTYQEVTAGGEQSNFNKLTYPEVGSKATKKGAKKSGRKSTVAKSAAKRVAKKTPAKKPVKSSTGKRAVKKSAAKKSAEKKTPGKKAPAKIAGKAANAKSPAKAMRSGSPAERSAAAKKLGSKKKTSSKKIARR